MPTPEDRSLLDVLEDLDTFTIDELFDFCAETYVAGDLDSSTIRRFKTQAEELLASNDQLRRELTLRKIAIEQLRILASAIHVTGDGVAILTPDRGGARIAFANRALGTITGHSLEETIGAGIEALGIPDDNPVYFAIQQHIATQKRFFGEVIATRRDRSEFALEIELVPIFEADEITHWVGLLRDVSDRRAQMLTLERQALYDVLTELPNRVLLFDRLEQAIANAEREMSMFALFVMDLDRFKEINDAFGHHAGDLLLTQVASRLRQQLRATDTVARLGGDEFAFLLLDLDDPARAIALAQKVLHVFDTPFPIEGRMIDVDASIGVVMWPQHGTDATILLRRADSAMYRAKETNAGVMIHDRAQPEEAEEQVTLATDLRRAIDENQLVLYYQPKVHIKTGVATRVEVLVRWQHPTRGLLFPLSFIPMAERTGLIKPMTDWVLDKALEQCRIWHDAGIPLHIACNLSTRSLQEPFLPEKIQEALEKWGMAPHVLKLEITESSILADPPQVMAVLALIQTLGVRLSIDDFGTGYSSLVHLRQLAVDEIKIDQSFVRDMCVDEADRAIVKATIDLAHSLGRQVVAEGVEDLQTLTMLGELGCDLAQGYYYTRPLPAAELERWLETSRWGLMDQ